MSKNIQEINKPLICDNLHTVMLIYSSKTLHMVMEICFLQ